MGKALDEHQLTLGMHLMRGRSLLDTYRLQPRVLQMHLFENVVGQHWFSLEKLHSCLLSPKIPILPCCPVRTCPIVAHGIAQPKHRDLVFGDTIPKHPTRGSPASK